MSRRLIALALAATLASVAGCGGEERSLRLIRVQPEADPGCGAPDDAVSLRVSAVGEFAPIDVTEVIGVADGRVSLSRFPPTTRALEVVVLGEGGVERAIGRTPTFALEEVEDGDELPVFMAPRRGFCPTGPPAAARDRPLLARAGDRVLVAGGFDDTGSPVRQVELYDPRSGRFEPLGEILVADADVGLAGATATTLGDGRVLIAGGPADAFQLFDPATASAGQRLFFEGAPAHHVAVELIDGRVLFAGGCDDVDASGVCPPGQAGSRDVLILDVDTQKVTAAAPLEEERIGGAAVLEGDGRITLVGGVDRDGNPVTTAERIDPTGVLAAELLDGEVGGAVAPLDGGGFLAVFAAPGEPVAPPGSAATAVIVSPTGSDPTVVARAATRGPRPGATVTALEDGRLLVLGGTGGAAAEAALYVPVDGRFVDLSSAPATARTGHAAIRLDDGSVLVVGGSDAGGALGDAWIYRPDLTGPFTPILDITFEGELAESLVPTDPAAVSREPATADTPARYVLTASGGAGGIPTAWAVIAGPRLDEPKIEASAGTDDGGGVAILFGFRNAQDFFYIVLRPGQAAELLHLGIMGAEVTGCASQTIVRAGQIEAAPDTHRIAVDVSDGQLTVSIDDEPVLSCDELTVPVGAVGIGIVGASGDRLLVDRVAVSR